MQTFQFGFNGFLAIGIGVTVGFTLGILAFYAIITALDTAPILSERDARAQYSSDDYYRWLHSRRPRTWAKITYLISIGLGFFFGALALHFLMSLYSLYSTPYELYYWLSHAISLLILLPIGFWFIRKYPK